MSNLEMRSVKRTMMRFPGRFVKRVVISSSEFAVTCSLKCSGKLTEGLALIMKSKMKRIAKCYTKYAGKLTEGLALTFSARRIIQYLKHTMFCSMENTGRPVQSLLPVLVLTLFTLSACGGSESAGPAAVDTTGSATAQSVPAEVPADQANASGQKAPPSVRYPQYPSAGNSEPPAVPFTNPFDDDPVAAQVGETLFAAMNCDGCHGGGGLGFVGPSLVDGRWRYGGDDGAVFQSIFYGRPRGMPAYGGLLNETVVWQLISYLRAQPEPSVVPTVAWVD